MNEPTALWSLKRRGCRCGGSCPSCRDCFKQIQVAAIRQRLGDMWLGIDWAVMPDERNGPLAGLIGNIWKQNVPDEMLDPWSSIPADLDSLADWLWERGVR